MENKETLDPGTTISYANSYFKVVPINDKVATVRPASAGEVLKWKSSIKDEPSERSTMVVLPIMIRNGVYKFVSNSWSEVFNSWSELYAYAVSQVNVDLVYDEFIEAVREALPECSAVMDGTLYEETKEALEEKDDYPETLESSGIELSEEEIKKPSEVTKKALEGKRTSWSDLYAYAVSRVNSDLVYDEFIEAVKEVLPDYSATIDEELGGGTKEALEGKRVSPETLESSNIELSKEDIKLEVSRDVDELIVQLTEIATNDSIREILSLINSTCNQEHDVLSIDWEIEGFEAVFRLDLMFETVRWELKKPNTIKTMNFFPIFGSLYD